MASSFGTQLRVQLFGQSHSAAVGCVVEGLPSGFALDEDKLARFMARRSPGKDPWSTPRKEADAVRILSGLNDHGVTCGTALALMIENTNTRSQDYDQLRRVPRPGHADLTAWHKWADAHDIRGGGHFSARLTAPLCAAGGIALQYLEQRGVQVAAHVAQVSNIYDTPFVATDNSPSALEELNQQMRVLSSTHGFPTIDPEAGRQMANLIDKVRRMQDSIGGAVECVATGMPAGVGGPRYDGVQSAIARIVFGIPAVRGLEFGVGFSVTKLRGSQNNDPFEMRDGVPVPATNNAGGTLGGITTGAPVLFRMAVKPTPSIAQPQQSVDLESKENVSLEVHGRHDPCVAPRAVPVAEAAMALALLDSWLAFPPSSGNW